MALHREGIKRTSMTRWMRRPRSKSGSHFSFSRLRLVLISLSLFACGSSFTCAAAKDGAASLFDKPLKTVKVPLAPDPGNPSAKPYIACFHYYGFMVKQIDLGEVGAAQLSIVPIAGTQEPNCVKENVAGEMVVDVKEWSGYFKGVKGDYVFFDADDGINGGLGFAVYKRQDGKKLFDDAAKSWQAIELKRTELHLRYIRTYTGSCSIFADAAGCWEKIKQSTGIQQNPPECSAAYRAEQKRMQGDKTITAGQIAAIPTVIDYEVETVLEEARHIITPRQGKLACRLAS